MTTHVLQFVELSDDARKEAGRLGKLRKGGRVEVRVKRQSGADQTLSLPPDAAALIEALLGHLLDGDRVAVLTEDQELSPNDAARILGASCPLVMHHMDIGDLPFRYVGKHRRATLKDVLGLKTRTTRSARLWRLLPTTPQTLSSATVFEPRSGLPRQPLGGHPM